MSDENKPEDIFIECIQMYNIIKKEQFFMWLLILFNGLVNMVTLYLLVK